MSHGIEKNIEKQMSYTIDNSRNPWEYDLLIKILIVGDSSVGKSCLLMRYADNEFNVSHQATIGVDCKIVTQGIAVNDHTTLRTKIQIWDTAGQERFRAITAGFYRGCHGVLLVYDKTNEESFHNVQIWLKEIQMHADPNVQVVLVANKRDLIEKIVVDRIRGEELAQELGIPFVETSAKDGNGVQEVFTKIAEKVTQPQNYLRNTTSTEEQMIASPAIPRNTGCC